MLTILTTDCFRTRYPWGGVKARVRDKRSWAIANLLSMHDLQRGSRDSVDPRWRMRIWAQGEAKGRKVQSFILRPTIPGH